MQSSKSSDAFEDTKYSWDDFEEDWNSERSSSEKPVSDAELHYHFGAETLERRRNQAARIEEGNQLVLELLTYVQAHRLPTAECTEKSNFILSKVKLQCPSVMSKITPDMTHDVVNKLSQDEKCILYDIAAEEYTEIRSFKSKNDSNDESDATSHESIDSDDFYHP